LDIAVLGQTYEYGCFAALLPSVQGELLAMPEGEHPRRLARLCE